jgi:hypothetical protein
MIEKKYIPLANNLFSLIIYSIFTIHMIFYVKTIKKIKLLPRKYLILFLKYRMIERFLKYIIIFLF